MAKRKRSSSPSIPQETLDRARQQAGSDNGSETEAAASAPVPAPVTAAPAAPKPAPIAASAPRTTSGAPRRRANYAQPSAAGTRSRRKSDGMTTAMVENLLEHPTKVVTEAELHAQYGFVLRDLRNMGILAAGLMLSLVILSIFFVR